MVTLFLSKEMIRDIVIKNFMNKLKEAKSQNARDVRLSLKEMEDIGYVIYELTAEFYARTMENGGSNNSKPKMDGGSF